MPNHEDTFADRLGRGDTLASAIAAALPAFDPADTTLSAVNFTAFVAALHTLNDEAKAEEDEYSTAAKERVAMVKDVKARAVRAIRYVRSNAAWTINADSLKLSYDRLVDNRPRAKPLPATGTPAEITRKIKTGEQSFSDIDSNFTKLVQGLSKVTGYDPPAAELALAELQALSASFGQKNKALATSGVTTALKTRARQAGFTDLREKALAIKNAVSSQYGLQSPVYLSIKGLKF